MRWQLTLKENITDLKSLLDILQIPVKDRPFLESDYGFSLTVSRHFVSLMEKGNIHDPLLRQILPMPEEEQLTQYTSLDPLQEKQSTPLWGCLHKYQGRILVITSGRCAINCRYCFRRHFPYENHLLSTEHWAKIVDYVRQDSSIQEVLFSGGEPFIVSDSKLMFYTQTLEEIAHVNLIRFHTRMLITTPNRMGESFFNMMQRGRIQKVIVLHVNHPRELHPVLLPAFERLRQMGVTLLNQSVLLKGVNDHVDTLEALSRTLFRYGILPYYLHQLDSVKGAGHFLVPLVQGRLLHQELKKRCPGYLVPRYVVELPGSPYKETLESAAPAGN